MYTFFYICFFISQESIALKKLEKRKAERAEKKAKYTEWRKAHSNIPNKFPAKRGGKQKQDKEK